MPLSLFGYAPKSRVEDRIGTESRYSHTFGGRLRDFDLVCNNAPRPLHLIYRLDLRDPLIPFRIPNIDFLPLLYCFNYGTDSCYQMVANSEINLIHPVLREHYYPPWGAPESFPQQDTSFSSRPFDPTIADDVMEWKGVFGWDELSPTERERALELSRERSPLTVNDRPDADWTYADVVRSMYHPPFIQSKPHNSCKNPNCDDDQLRVIALQDNVVLSELIWPDRFVQTIWEICDCCHSITVSNQCA